MPFPNAEEVQKLREPALLLQAAIRPAARGQWCRIRVIGVQASACLGEFRDAMGMLVGVTFLRALRGAAHPSRETLCVVPPEAVELRIRAARARPGPDVAPAATPRLVLRSMPRWRAALRMLVQQPGVFAELLAASLRQRQRPSPRQMLTLVAAERARLDVDYATWIALFDRWDAAAPSPAGPSIGYAIFVADAESAQAALAATLDSVAAQPGAVPSVVMQGEPTDAAAWRARLTGLGTDYIGLLQAGEILPAHATSLAAAALRGQGATEIAIADEDALTPEGARQEPFFRPVPDRYLMLSGTLSRGLWLVAAPTLACLPVAPTTHAEALRLDLWLRRREAGPEDFSRRLPFILTHRRADAEVAPPAMLAAVAQAHLTRAGLPFASAAAWPLRLRRLPATAPGVTAIIPSTLRQPHSLRCIAAILEGTAYPDLAVEVVVSLKGEADAAQRAAAARIEAFPNARVTWLTAPSFNFSTVNNHIIGRTSGTHLLLLNDDVTPTAADWLDWMVAYLADPQVGVVGARLLYPDGTVQHGGVIMGLSGFCEHAHRGLPQAEPGYGFRAVLPQRLLAVTAACMLVRRSVMAEVGGLDEGYPSAFNDVDLALRIHERGHAVIYAPQAELIHHELQTYGSHYAGERQPFYKDEVARMRRRWAPLFPDDPYYNPNLALDPGREWQLAIPPRIDGRAAARLAGD